jgi:hypothetical protein
MSREADPASSAPWRDALSRTNVSHVVKSLVVVTVLLAASALAVALMGSPFRNSRPDWHPTAREYCGGKNAPQVCLRVVRQRFGLKQPGQRISLP